jgi:6-phospho-beta-glucosidase
MKSGTRIAVVGGGSQYAIGLAESLIDYARDLLAGAKVMLLDIKAEHLKVVNDYASGLAAATGVDMVFEATTDRRRAFDGAEFIITTFRPGSHQEQLWDETVPVKYGLLGNETIGIGGIFMACRVVPVLREMCADAQQLCPDAWIINYTNPTQYVADAIRRLSDLRCIGLCDGYMGVANYLAPLLGVEPEDITIYPAGTNHATWVMRFTVRGQDGYPILRQRMDELTWEEIETMYAPPPDFEFLGERVPAEVAYPQFLPGHYFPFSLRLYDLYGLLPAPRYYWRYHLDTNAVILEEQSPKHIPMARFYIDHAVPRMFRGLERRLELMSKERKTVRREGGASHGDLAVRVISAMVNNLKERFVVNVPNRGAISNLPENSIVEVGALVDRLGPHPFAVGPMPRPLLGYQYARILSQELAIDAALSGSRADLLRAILADPLVHSIASAERAMEELLKLQAQWLPQFAT